MPLATADKSVIKLASILQQVRQLDLYEKAQLLQILEEEFEEDEDELLATNQRIRKELDQAWEEYRQGKYKTLQQLKAEL